MAYLRRPIGRWSINLDSGKAREMFNLIQTEGRDGFYRRFGSVRYRPMKADSRTRGAVVAWEPRDWGWQEPERYGGGFARAVSANGGTFTFWDSADDSDESRIGELNYL